MWGDRKACIPKMLQTVKLFAGSGAAIAFEDVPLNGEEAAWFSDFPAGGDYGLLADLGHMNLRLSKAGDNSPEAFAQAYAALPLHVYELHLHNNDGVKDMHDMMWNGTMDYAAVAAQLHRAHFDGVFTIESVPGWHGMTGNDADAAIFRCRDYWQELWTR